MIQPHGKYRPPASFYRDMNYWNQVVYHVGVGESR